MDIKPNLLQLKFDDCDPVRDCSSARRVVLKWRRKYFCVLVSNWGEAIGIHHAVERFLENCLFHINTSSFTDAKDIDVGTRERTIVTS